MASTGCHRSRPSWLFSSKVSLPVPPRQPFGSFATPAISTESSLSVRVGAASRKADGAHPKMLPLSSVERGIPQTVPDESRNSPNRSPVPFWWGVGSFAVANNFPKVFSSSATGVRGAWGRFDLESRQEPRKRAARQHASTSDLPPRPSPRVRDRCLTGIRMAKRYHRSHDNPSA